jgi:glycosyltransferase involved in cell wall biosynthesis
MRILWVATKAPSPITDGGRAVMLATIECLAASADVRLTVVTPLPIESIEGDGKSVENPTIVRSVQENLRFLSTDSYFLEWPNSVVRSFRSGRPVSVERHGHAPLAALVEGLIRDEPPFDVVHSEQLQALPIAEPARRAGVACVLRAQNVESAVWEATASEAPAWRAAAMRLEARRMRRFEAAEIGNVDATITLSAEDAAALAALCPAAAERITAVPPPIPLAWNAPDDRAIGSKSGIGSDPRIGRDRPIDGNGRPAFIWIGSAGWAPNDCARGWLLDDIWPAIAARVPDACLHVFGARDAHGAPDARGAIVWRGTARESAEAFMPGGVVLLPMRSAAGVRMRVLEAWARGLPVIASPAAIAGLEAEDGRDVMVAADGRAFAEAAARVAAEPSLRARLVEGGRATLARRHDPKRIAAATLDVYRQAIEWRRARPADSVRGCAGPHP